MITFTREELDRIHKNTCDLFDLLWKKQMDEMRQKYFGE